MHYILSMFPVFHYFVYNKILYSIVDDLLFTAAPIVCVWSLVCNEYFFHNHITIMAILDHNCNIIAAELGLEM